jgi:hypothetical protein
VEAWNSASQSWTSMERSGEREWGWQRVEGKTRAIVATAVLIGARAARVQGRR